MLAMFVQCVDLMVRRYAEAKPFAHNGCLK